VNETRDQLTQAALFAKFQYLSAQQRYRVNPTPANQRLMAAAQQRYQELEKKLRVGGEE